MQLVNPDFEYHEKFISEQNVSKSIYFNFTNDTFFSKYISFLRLILLLSLNVHKRDCYYVLISFII